MSVLFRVCVDAAAPPTEWGGEKGGGGLERFWGGTETDG